MWDGKGAQHAKVPPGSGLSDVLAAIPEHVWLNLWIMNTIGPPEAISWGTGAPGRIAERLERRKRLALEAMSE